MRLNFPVVLSIMGLLLIINSLAMLLSLSISIAYGEEAWKPMVYAAGITLFAGAILRLVYRKFDNKDIRKREGYLIVTMGWLVLTLSGTLPYLFSGTTETFADAFFETMSGYTTTGATILTDIEIQSKTILFWRSLTHWIGGMGIIVLTIAILPLLGIGGMQLFSAEASGPTPAKLHPRIKETAKRLWIIYVALTGLETVLLMLGEMTFFDAVNHSMSTMATGGFSTKNASLAFYSSPYIQYVVLVFMFLGGTSFPLIYFGLRGKLLKVFHNEEFRAYLFACMAGIVLTTTAILVVTDLPLERAFRDAAFQIVSIITTTGFITADYTAWAPFVTVLFFVLFFTGASTGSTSGGIKMMRHVILIKNSVLEFKRQVHPSAIIPVRFNGKAVTQNISYHISAFILLYLLIFFAGSLVMAAIGLDFESAIGSVAASLGNIGPAIGSVGPASNFAHIPAEGKWFLSFLMLLGRLEIFTVLILLTPYFWRRH
ncbi:MAG: TrkH family potassium uptake protein [Bacteroidia bacterium]